ncbi:Short-chain dehydrogenase/reductase SDR (plasmid) [Neorhizobium galegae bv. officinalis bv. officinalis str. HAMBI 1141]|uniref:Short-chain dehydrogenase/reductase SDR n=1 Tax=Neorhizobium galegae bv. officinalis bv. officinalis str. HAMBI 1141 TaxID=1028801 RepID=A0A068TIT9_NEOGA|nr:SDR family oxidoreductase [Neorhizobium galegae]CDN58024.1 Short-chain dehydrogenase/reductase SDR [Neorhizobium galegae bv. officinalis bv. officinalis str. HAMBI 1141]
MDLGISGRNAIVTGASRGMGKAAAMALARENVDLAIIARTPETLQATAAEIRAATGARVTAVVGDITTLAGREAVLSVCPKPDILVNNADGELPGDFRNWSREDWLRGIDRMMLTPIDMMRLTVDGMMAREFGRIVNIVSRSVKIAQAELGMSNAARSGLVGFVAGLARQTIAHNVTINNVLPGIVASDGQRQHVEVLAQESGRSFDEIWAARAAQNPAGRYGRPEEIGAYIAFLCSANAGFVTAQNLLIDGGQYPGTF